MLTFIHDVPGLLHVSLTL